MSRIQRPLRPASFFVDDDDDDDDDDNDDEHHLTAIAFADHIPIVSATVNH